MQALVKRNSFKTKELCKLEVYKGGYRMAQKCKSGVDAPGYDWA